MKNVCRIFLVFFLLNTVSNDLFSQKAFNDCSAICLDKKALVEEYSPAANCKINKNAKGLLGVYTVELSKKTIRPKQEIGFKVAIKDNRTNTLWMYSEKTYREIDVQEILSKCSPGDQILLLTVDKAYALPHSTITVI